MSEMGEAKAKEDVLVSGAKPRLEERVRERGWRPTGERHGLAPSHTEAARRLAIAQTADGPASHQSLHSMETA
jgi:hypothetical protein